MKKILFAVAAATMIFASCSKEGGENNPAGEQATITIGIADNGTRAAGQVTGDADNTIGQFKAFVFAGETLQAVLTSSDGTAQTDNTNVTTSADMVYVIANANGVSAISGLTKGSISKTDFLKLTGNLLTGSTFAAQTGGKVWASKSETVAFNGSNVADINVSVVPVPARINVTVTDNRDHKTDAAAFKITKVQMLNVPQTAGLNASVTPTAWYTGYAASSSSNAADVDNAYFSDTYSSTGHHFYTFENSNATYPTIVTLVTENNAGKVRYYPVHFKTGTGTGSNANKVIERGKSYQVAITLSGDALDDTDIDDPEEPIVIGTLKVTVSSTPWDMVGIDKNL